MTKLRTQLTILGCLTFLILSGCGETDEITEADIQATVDAAVAGTTVALAPPTFTPIPTITSIPEESDASTDQSDQTQTDDTGAEDSAETPEPTATPAPPPTDTPSVPFIRTELDNGSIRYDQPLDGFALTLSDEWVVADIYQITNSADQKQLEELMGSGIFRNLVASGIKFYAINLSQPSLDSLSPININIAKVPSNGLALETAAAQYADDIAYQLDLFRSEIAQSGSSLGETPTERLEYTIAQVNPLEREFSLQLVQHLVQQGDELLLITITIPTELATDYLPSAETALQTLEVYGQ